MTSPFVFGDDAIERELEAAADLARDRRRSRALAAVRLADAGASLAGISASLGCSLEDAAELVIEGRS